MLLSLDKTGVKAKFEFPYPPDPDKIRVEVANLQKPFPKFTKEPEQAVKASKGTQWIRLGEKPEDQTILLKVDISMRRTLDVSVKPFVQMTKEQKPELLNKVSKKKLNDFVNTAVQTASIQVARFANAQPPKERGQKAIFEQQKNLANQLSTNANAAKVKVDKLNTLYDAVNEQGKIDVRVFYATETGEVDLLRTK